MGMFITDADRVWVTEDGEVDERDLTPATDAVAIYPTMPYGVQQKVIGTAVRMAERKAGTAPRGRRRETETTYDLESYSIALLVCNVLDWRGPSFTLPDGGKRPCVEAQIRALNPQMPLVVKVLAEIGERNQTEEERAAAQEAAGPNPPAPA